MRKRTRVERHLWVTERLGGGLHHALSFDRLGRYFTTRELSSHAAELFALRSLGDEIVSTSTTTPPGDWCLKKSGRIKTKRGHSRRDSVSLSTRHVGGASYVQLDKQNRISIKLTPHLGC